MQALKDRLVSLGNFPEGIDGFEYAVNFFNAVADFRQNVKFFENAPSTVHQAQEKLNNMIYDFGTGSDCKFNRASGQEKVSLENMYWGGIFGLFTKTAKHWMETDSVYAGFAERWLVKPDPEDEETMVAYQKLLNPPVYEVIIQFQVRPIIENTCEKILELCDVLLSAE